MANARFRYKEYHRYHTVYQTLPETQKVLDIQTEQLKKFEEEAKERSDPKLYVQNSQKLVDTFVEKLPSLKLTDVIDKQIGENHIGFIGQVSSGKTSMINAMFNKNFPVALGNCTEKRKVVHKEDENVIWDGQNDDFNFYNPINLSFVKNLDKCVILFDNDISMISNVLKVVHKINPNNMVIIRTKVDQHHQFNVRTIQEEQRLDQEKVKNLLGVEIKTYCVSSHNIIDNKPNMYDWLDIKRILGIH